MPPGSRGKDRTVHYTMKATRPSLTPTHSHSRGHSHSQSHSHSQTSSQPHRSSKPGTPMASPRMPHSVGQPYPPKLSPSTATRVSTQVPEARSSSPNYFGLVVEHATDPRDSSRVPRENWSSPTSSVKSLNTAIPKQLPLNANPEFEAFRRQADANRGGGAFALNSGQFARTVAGTPQPTVGAISPTLLRPRQPRWHNNGSDAASEPSMPRSSALAAGSGRPRDMSSARMDVDVDSNSLHDSAYVSADSKRNSEASLNPPSLLNLPRHESPAQLDSPFDARMQVLSKVEDRHPRLSVTGGKSAPPGTGSSLLQTARADTVPAKLEAGGPTMMGPAQLRNIMEGSAKEALLLLDVRVATHCSASRIRGALNLCIPTTLLKRATYNLQKLQLTFQRPEERERFASWRNTQFLVVYDSSSTEKRDAVAAMNMLNKFTKEGYKGSASVLRGGFNHFVTAYPHLIDHRSSDDRSGSPSSFSLASGAQRRPVLPSVIGGVALPNATSNPNPFFSNIRQNMDLADGVGQMDITVPPNIDTTGFPLWLREAAEPGDRGKKVADRFLRIELAEQARMKNAYSVNPVTGAGEDDNNVQLSGIEKGTKNRYKDILPFEHARVRLQGRSDGDCDYVNASHIIASRSHKRYIASQGPLPATFEDFWSVIWDHDVRVIVMLTAELEGGQLKCHPYWTTTEFGPIRLRSLSEKKVSLDMDKHRSPSAMSSASSSNNSAATVQVGTSAAEQGRRRANTTTTLEGSTPMPAQPNLNSSTGPSDTPFVVIRKFALSHAAYPFAPIREITHLHYPSWPDFGAPAQPSHLLALIELANAMQRAASPINVHATPASASASSTSSGGRKSRSESTPISWHDEPESSAQTRPMLIHCSAGCGRTGTFCTVDSVMDMVKRQRMQAVKKADASIAARERKLLEMQNQEVDADGDVSMDEFTAEDDLDSPLSGVLHPPTFPQEMSLASLKAGNSPGDQSPRAHEERLDLAWLDDDTVDLIAVTVEDFRKQRLSMVQSLRQFVLCYETVAEWIWRLQERPGVGRSGRGRARSGSLGAQRPS